MRTPSKLIENCVQERPSEDEPSEDAIQRSDFGDPIWPVYTHTPIHTLHWPSHSSTVSLVACLVACLAIKNNGIHSTQ